ncbi:hypothetical protein ACWEWX_46690, partial [Streptomyces asiaticus]
MTPVQTPVRPGTPVHVPGVPDDTVLSVRGLRKDFTLHTIDGRTVDALHGVDLDVRPGEVPSWATGRPRCGTSGRTAVTTPRTTSAR